jgi:hypothetical protein
VDDNERQRLESNLTERTALAAKCNNNKEANNGKAQ